MAGQAIPDTRIHFRGEVQGAQTCNGTRPPYRRLTPRGLPPAVLGRTGKRGTSHVEVYRAQKSLATPTFAPCAIDLVTRAEARHILGGVSDATLYRGVASGRYPAPIKIGPNTSRWNRAKLEACIEQLEADGHRFERSPHVNAP